jgi:hypothetical protein
LVKILKFFDADPGSGMGKVRIRDPGWKKFGYGIRDKHPGSAKLVIAWNNSVRFLPVKKTSESAAGDVH